MAENIDTNFNFSGFNTLKKDLRDAVNLYQQMLASGTATTEQIEAQAKVVARLKDEIDDANDATAALTGAGRIQAFGKAVSAVAGGFTALQGVIALTGNESENLQKTMVKLQAALAISQGISQMEDLGNAFKNASRAIGLTTLATQAYTFVTSAATVATKALRAALVTTGAGAILVGLGLIVNKLFEMGSAAKDSEEEVKDLGQSLKDLNQNALEAFAASADVIKNQTEDLIRQIRTAQEAGQQTVELVYLDGTRRTLRLTKEEITKFFEERKRLELEQLNYSIAIQQKELQKAKETEKEKSDAAYKADQSYQRALLNRSMGMAQSNEKNLKAAKEKSAAEAADAIANARKQDAVLKNLMLKRAQLERSEANELIEAEQSARAATTETLEDRIKKYQQTVNAEAELDAEAVELNLRFLRAESENEKEIRLETLKATQEIADLKRKAEENALEYEIEQKKKAGQDVTQLEEDLRLLRSRNFAIREVEAQELANLEKQLAKEVADKEIAQQERVRQEREETRNFAEDAITRATNWEIYQIERSDRARRIRDKKIIQAEIQKFEALIALYKLYGKDAREIEMQLYEFKQQVAVQEVQDKIDVANAALNLGSSITQGLMNLDNIRTQNALNNTALTEEQRERIAKDSFERQKNLQYAGALIDGAKAITSILAQYPKFDGGIAMGLALAAATVTTAFQLAVIKNTEYVSPVSGNSDAAGGVAGSKFAGGGMLIGPSHNQGGIKSMMGELEGGEFIVNRVAAQQFLPILESINSMGQDATSRMKPQDAPIIKTYVVASDMVNEMQKKKRIQKLSRL